MDFCLGGQVGGVWTHDFQVRKAMFSGPFWVVNALCLRSMFFSRQKAPSCRFRRCTCSCGQVEEDGSLVSHQSRQKAWNCRTSGVNLRHVEHLQMMRFSCRLLLTEWGTVQQRLAKSLFFQGEKFHHNHKYHSDSKVQRESD